METRLRPNPSIKRNVISGLFLLAKEQLISAISLITKKEIFKVQITNAQKFQEYLAQISNRIDKLNGVIRELPKISIKGALNFPRIQQVSGNVKVINQREFPLQRLLTAFQDLETSVRSIRLEVPPQKEIRIPEFPTTINIGESKAILKALKEVSDKLDELPKSFPEVDIPSTVTVSNFPPQKYPMPVSNININPLRGFIKSRNITVTTTLTPLPDEILAYRRGIIIFNNDSTVTLFIGGSDVTTTNGLPVPPKSYSPPIDAGPKLVVYGIAASSINVRVAEVSNENIGG